MFELGWQVKIEEFRMVGNECQSEMQFIKVNLTFHQGNDYDTEVNNNIGVS